jgi:predicted Na+-dependent transporter
LAHGDVALNYHSTAVSSVITGADMPLIVNLSIQSYGELIRPTVYSCQGRVFVIVLGPAIGMLLKRQLPFAALHGKPVKIVSALFYCWCLLYRQIGP